MLTKQLNTKEITLGYPLVDWFTVTAFDGESWDYWTQAIKVQGIEELAEPTKVMQYLGFPYRVPNGSLWLGSGEQKGRMHNMVRASGEVSNGLFDMFCGRPCLHMWAKCTRLDLQITVQQPDEWSQWRLFNRLKKSGLTVSYVSSRSGKNGRELATVYVGSRSSQRMARIYEKESKSGMLLRLEVEFKSDRANKMARMLAEERQLAGDYLLYELQQMTDGKLEKAFHHALADNNARSEKIRKVKSESSTGKWLLGTVLPSFIRHIEDHESGGEVLTEFYNACMRRIERGVLQDGTVILGESNE